MVTLIGTKLALAGGTLTGSVIFNDNVQLKVGTGLDFRIFHNATDTILQNVTGHVYLENHADDKSLIFRTKASGGSITEVLKLDEDGDIHMKSAQKIHLYANGLNWINYYEKIYNIIIVINRFIANFIYR